MLLMVKGDNQRGFFFTHATGQLAGSDQANVLRIVDRFDLKGPRE